ncbi:hypothetical protein [Flavobacterium sp. J27]|uniref:hypothetical protein n=1 Tax=Flavobacterium sp. J27 TaxID=2060419 RepID=UPI0010324BB8|nr:hypothetical protein [Flavobacterium sp. J27]
MLDYNKLTPSDLAKIINDQKTVVIQTNQLLTNTVKNEINKWVEYSIPVISNDELVSVLATTFNSSNMDENWNPFILTAYNLNAKIKFKNTNQVDCIVEISFEN